MKYTLIGESDLIVLQKHSFQFEDEIGQELVTAEGFVYSCKAILYNMKRQLEGCNDKITQHVMLHSIYYRMDGVYTVLDVKRYIGREKMSTKGIDHFAIFYLGLSVVMDMLQCCKV